MWIRSASAKKFFYSTGVYNWFIFISSFRRIYWQVFTCILHADLWSFGSHTGRNLFWKVRNRCQLNKMSRAWSASHLSPWCITSFRLLPRWPSSSSRSKRRWEGTRTIMFKLLLLMWRVGYLGLEFLKVQKISCCNTSHLQSDNQMPYRQSLLF